ncbi:MAG TPA: DUF1345 domain-containing protein [Mycobacteriales bacterium]|nr:DUF1345 domain-containing protein [Mycobacteriales bacterium]
MATVVGLLAGATAAALGPWDLAPLLGWDSAAAVLVCWIWIGIGRLDAERTAQRAEREDPTVPSTDLLLLSAAVASLVAVGLVLVRASSSGGTELVSRVALGVGSVVLSWALVHTIFTLRYARLYYSGRDGGVDFHDRAPPCYLDFAYLSFTVGMTFQVSDTDVQDAQIRHTVLRHALLSYLFGAVIVAGTINLVAGLTK